MKLTVFNSIIVLMILVLCGFCYADNNSTMSKGGFTGLLKPEIDEFANLTINQMLSEGRNLEINNSFLEAGIIYEKIINSYPHNVNTYIVLAQMNERSGNLSRALNVISRGIEKNPDSFLLWMEKGTIFEGLNKPDRALESYKQAYRLEPANQTIKFKISNMTGES